MKDVALVVAFLVIFVLGITFSIWAAFFAPCDAIGWLPISDTPGRCLR